MAFVYLDLADLIGLEFWRAVVVDDADASHQLANSRITKQNVVFREAKINK